MGGGACIGCRSVVGSCKSSGVCCVATGADTAVLGVLSEGLACVRGEVDAGGGITTGAGVSRDWDGSGEGAGVTGGVVSGGGSRSAGGASKRKSRSSGGVVVVASWANETGAPPDMRANAMKQLLIRMGARSNLVIDIAFSMPFGLNPQ